MSGRTLVLGGVRSGKSAWAEREITRLAAAGDAEVTYVATAAPYPEDPEWQRRIATHRRRRPDRWRTVETAQLAPLLAAATPEQVLLVDDAGNWLTRHADDCGAWDADAGVERLRHRVDELVRSWSRCQATVVVVSNEVGSGVVPATPSGRRFRDELGRLNTQLAAACDRAVLLVAGLPLWLRGKDET